VPARSFPEWVSRAIARCFARFNGVNKFNEIIPVIANGYSRLASSIPALNREQLRFRPRARARD
jgi:hypothetical protein